MYISLYPEVCAAQFAELPSPFCQYFRPPCLFTFHYCESVCDVPSFCTKKIPHDDQYNKLVDPISYAKYISAQDSGSNVLYHSIWHCVNSN